MNRLLDALFAKAEGTLVIWTMPDKDSIYFDLPEKLNEATKDAELLREKHDVYFGVCTHDMSRVKKSSRGTAETIKSVPALYADFDLLDADAHKSTNLPTCVEDLKAWLQTLPLYPSALVFSGHGVHAYWILSEPILVDGTRITAGNVKATMKQWGDAINIHASLVNGWVFDSVSEPARVLRVPGTWNHKTQPPIPVVLDPDSTFATYTFTDIAEAMKTLRKQTDAGDDAAIARGGEAFKMPEAIPDGGRNATMFKLASSLRAKGMEQSEIEAGLVAANLRCKPPLPESELRSIAASAMRYVPGVSTQTLAEHTISMDIPDPATIGAAELLSDGILEAALCIDSEVERQRRYTMLYSRAKELGMARAFDSMWKVKKNALSAAKARAMHNSVERGDAIVLTDCPIEGLKVDEWEVDENGVRRSLTVKGNTTVMVACSSPVVILERLCNVDSQAEKVRIAWKRPNEKWQDIVALRSILASKQSIVQLADTGLQVHSESAKHLVQYLADLEAQNLAVIPKRRSVSRCGWIGTDCFAPYAPDITFDGDPRMRTMFDAVRASGSKDEWLKEAVECRGRLMPRTLLAASFAAPIVWLLGKPVFFVHMWGDTGTGKTVGLYLSASVWGDPRALAKSFNATGVGMERNAAFMHSIPLFLDEFQTLDKRKTDVDNLMYTLAEGKSKGRGTKFGGIEQESRWGNVILTNGEEPMTTDRSGGGAKNRAIELYINGPLFESAPDTAGRITSNYGHAGQMYINGLIDLLNGGGGLKELQRVYSLFRSVVGNDPIYTDKQLGALTLLLMADYFSSMLVFGETEDEAMDGAMKLCVELMPGLSAAREVDQVVRAWDWFLGWLASNRSRFDDYMKDKQIGPMYGKVEGGDWLVVASVANSEMDHAGFSSRKCFKAFSDRGWIVSPVAKDEGRSQFKTRVGGVAVWCYKVRMEGEDVLP